MKIKIKKANLSHFKIFQKLNNELFKYDAQFDPALNLDWPYKKIGIKYYQNILTSKKSICFLAENEKEDVVGYIAGSITKKFSYRKGMYAELDNIFILANYRGKGIGNKLVNAFLSWAKKKEIKRIYVSGYFKDKKAVNFYKKNGFKPIDLGLEMELQ